MSLLSEKAWVTATASSEPSPPLSGRCIACGGRSFRRVDRRLPWLSECRGCGLGFVDPQPDDAELAGIYDDRYYETFGHFADGGEAYHELKRAWADRLLRQMERRVAPGRLLDVGSALGDLLYVARRRGWQATGVEPNAFAAERSLRLVPEAAVVASLLEAEAGHAPFDLIICNDVLEHVRRPDEEVRRFCQCLRPGGWLVGTTIDRGGLSARLAGSRWVHYHRDHLWYFTRPTLVRLAEAAGFRDIHCRATWKLYHLD
jgi:SAM-dependent methyltransferase